MMDNAADEKARLGLVVGQALTQDQINALNEDIIWYVSKEVNGVSVLTPQIYLSSRTRESISDDTRNRVGGINGTYVKTKDFVNIAKNLKVDDKKVLLVLPEVEKNVYLSARNLKKAEVMTASQVNSYKVLNADVLVVTENSLKVIDEILTK